ncbi:hypothetical protein AMIS_21280 [Actinoplanes missouriensis 431]|uniref:Uncharacterized protein n=1 Tax=Actinoplanes missouriensis (strain ATCC 14538 / DSM 43046 / CBS 188.64 / JCM 3121 / NBRC 102363 / NCIMB 12654 / NRRL B-3342 / UNCC 431) TaxID=512565 RepID=I0H2W1_ACTM4|nr:hypothetical protein [Actinoplanes missouriensis]BAL87348.1 hypothetical protein AMIS_21280 [Actinoplanes missouriensis 431]
MLPDGFEWAVPGARGDVWCVRRAGARLMLCGWPLTPGKGQDGFVPVIQPADPPAEAHGRCVALLAGLHGVCPVCGGDIATEDGRIVAHGAWVRTVDGVERSETPCSGAGELPDGER